MKALGGLLRYILNINTVWGLMILSAFALCVVQHYRPTTTVVPGNRLRPGDNTLTIRLGRPNGETQSFDYPLTLQNQAVVIQADDKTTRKDRPWLISAEAVGSGYVLKWDDAGYGPFTVLLNGAAIGQGKLVTLQTLTDAGFEYATKGFDIALGLVAAMVLFLGLMKVGEDAGLVALAARILHPLIRLIFPGIPRDHPANGAVLMNMTTGILGLGNAATPMGIKAMKELETLNPHPGIATDSQVTLLAWNTGGLALLPTTLLAVRKTAGCSNPFEIIGTCLVAGLVSSIVAITAARLLGKLPIFSVSAALAEDQQISSPTATEIPALASSDKEEA